MLSKATSNVEKLKDNLSKRLRRDYRLPEKQPLKDWLITTLDSFDELNAYSEVENTLDSFEIVLDIKLLILELSKISLENYKNSTNRNEEFIFTTKIASTHTTYDLLIATSKVHTYSESLRYEIRK